MWRLSSGRLPPSCRALLSPLPVCPERDPIPHPSVPSSQISRKKFLLFYFEGGLVCAGRERLLSHAHATCLLTSPIPSYCCGCHCMCDMFGFTRISHLAASSAPEPESDCLCPERMFCLLWNAHERQRAVDNMRDAVAAHSQVRAQGAWFVLCSALALTERSRAHAQADAITGFMHRTGENRSAQFRAAAMRGSAGNESAAQEAAEITGVR